MKRNRFFLLLFAALAVLLAACQDSSDEAGSESAPQTEENSGTEQTNEDSAENNDTEETDEQEDTAEDTTEEPAEETPNTSGNDESEEPASRKEEYLTKLDEIDQEMKEMMENSTAGTTVEMKKEAEDRWLAWDGALNEIYAVLEEQLSEEEMGALRAEQRNWIKHRDSTAKQASLKYEGGTQENVEYTAVMAEVTRERCYELVNEYMQ